jgi:hypothetical protein
VNPDDIRKLAAALAAEVNAKQSADYEARASKDVDSDALLASKKGEKRAVALIVRRADVETSSAPAAAELAAKLAAKLDGKSGALTVLASRAPSAADAEAWSEAAAELIPALEKAGGESDLLTLYDPPAGSPFDYVSWAPAAKGGLILDVLVRPEASKEKTAAAGTEDHWLILLGHPESAGKAAGSVFTMDLAGQKISRAWWAKPKDDGFSFRRF